MEELLINLHEYFSKDKINLYEVLISLLLINYIKAFIKGLLNKN